MSFCVAYYCLDPELKVCCIFKHLNRRALRYEDTSRPVMS